MTSSQSTPNLFDRVLDLIGKSEETAEYAALLKDVGREPEITERPNGWSRMIYLPAVGLGLVSHLIDDNRIFRGAFIWTAADEEGRETVSKLGGNLPASIRTSDGQAEVAQKLGQQPTASRSSTKVSPDGHPTVCDSYILSGSEVEFYFDTVSGALCFWAISALVKEDAE